MGEKAIFSAYFYLEIQEHSPTTTQQLEGMPGKAIYIRTTDNIVIGLPFLRELILCICLSPTVSLRHFDPYIQADIWLEKKGAKRPQRCEAKAKCSQGTVGDEVDGAPWTAGWRGPARTRVC